MNKKDNRLKNLLIFVLVIFVGTVLVLVFVINNKKKSLTFLCPDDYENFEDQIADFDKFSKDFFDNNPEASITDLFKERLNFYKENNCTEALKRYNEYQSGDVSEENKTMIESVVDEALLNTQ